MPVEEVEGRLVGQLPGLEVNERFEHRKARRGFAHVGPEAYFAEVVAMPPVAPHEDRELARSGRPGQHPRCLTTDLHVIQPYVISAYSLREIVQKRKCRHTVVLQVLHHPVEALVVHRDGSDGIGLPSHVAQEVCELLGRLGLREAQMHRAAQVGPAGHGRLDLPSERPVEGLLLLQEDHPEAQFGHQGVEPVIDEATRVVADPAGRLGDLAQGLVANLRPPVQRAVDGSDADMRFAGDIADRGAAGHGHPSGDISRDFTTNDAFSARSVSRE